MSPVDRLRTAGRARRHAPRLERLESRDLPTFTLIHHATGLAPALLAAATPGQAATTSASASGGSISASQTSGPVLGPPTPREAAKQHFIAKLKGNFVTTQGRFQNQPVQGLILATGGSNQSLRLNAQFQFFLYSDANFPPTGQIALSPKNVSSTGNLLLLDLTADPTMTSHGLPTHYTWTVNAGSGGLYLNATGQGTLDVSYSLVNRPIGVHGKGTAIVVVRGMVVTTHGLTLDTSAPGNRTKNP